MINRIKNLTNYSSEAADNEKDKSDVAMASLSTMDRGELRTQIRKRVKELANSSLSPEDIATKIVTDIEIKILGNQLISYYISRYWRSGWQDVFYRTNKYLEQVWKNLNMTND